MFSRKTAGSLTAILATILFLAHPKAAPTGGEEAAEDASDPTTKVQKLNRYAMQLFDEKNYALAEKTLLDAMSIVEKSNLANGPAGLATNGNLAVLYSVGLKNPDKAVAHFKKALVIKPDLKMGKSRSTPETEANLTRAKAELAGGAPAAAGGPAAPGGKQGGPAVESKAAESGGNFKCPTGGEIQSGEEVTLKCVSSGDLNPMAVMLYYKPNGADDYQAMTMVKGATAGGATTWTAKIPGTQTKAKWVPIYFEARNESGETLALSGRDDSPSVIMVKGGEGATAGSDKPAVAANGEEGEGDEEEEGDEIDDNNPLARLERERRREHEGSKGTWFFGGGLGTGVGYASGHGTEAFGKYGVGFNPGIAFSGLGQMALEMGYFVGRATSLSAAFRGQRFLSSGPDGTATGALAGLLRLAFYTDDDDKLRWYFSCVGGYGDAFRFQVDAQVLDSTGNPTGSTVKDTVKGGPFVVGVGGGMLYKIGRRLFWTIDTQFLVGFSSTSAVLDLTSGIRTLF